MYKITKAFGLPKLSLFSYYKVMLLQVRIQDLVKLGAPASVAESCQHSEAESRKRNEQSAAGVQGP